ncbi:MAG: hypothetical protein LBD06_12220 [Candidatus Accumulibacter sp.]|nr:hypothetical protein [Accumulibacter sp.]
MEHQSGNGSLYQSSEDRVRKTEFRENRGQKNQAPGFPPSSGAKRPTRSVLCLLKLCLLSEFWNSVLRNGLYSVLV